MTIINLLSHVLTLIFFIAEIFYLVQRIKEPLPFDIGEAVIIYLRALMILFVIPILYIAKAVMYFLDIQPGYHFFQFKLFYWFLYILLVGFIGLKILELIFY